MSFNLRHGIQTYTYQNYQRCSAHYSCNTPGKPEQLGNNGGDYGDKRQEQRSWQNNPVQYSYQVLLHPLGTNARNRAAVFPYIFRYLNRIKSYLCIEIRKKYNQK